MTYLACRGSRDGLSGIVRHLLCCLLKLMHRPERKSHYRILHLPYSPLPTVPLALLIMSDCTCLSLESLSSRSKGHFTICRPGTRFNLLQSIDSLSLSSTVPLPLPPLLPYLGSINHSGSSIGHSLSCIE